VSKDRVIYLNQVIHSIVKPSSLLGLMILDLINSKEEPTHHLAAWRNVKCQILGDRSLDDMSFFKNLVAVFTWRCDMV
jgi:hypothetical protein